jgi:maltooligosyltrehalose trehalohydrolase
VSTGHGHGTLYKFVVDGRELPDPYARSLPHGVHGPAMVIAPGPASLPRASRPLHEQVIYELHVGTFSVEGTYAAAAERLRELADLGVTTIELMPVSSFAGRWGWGYDGVAHFAPFAPYGAPDDLRAFVARAHDLGLAVILDVVYNHFGPAGNYLAEFSPAYFSTERTTPWGRALDFTQPAMRGYVLDNARYWFEEFGFDGLRLDAVHAIEDPSEKSILKELVELARSFDPPRLLIAEDDRNDPSAVLELGLDALWADDFHHQVRVTLTGERDGYYAGYQPGVADLARAIARGWLYEGQCPPGKSEGRGKPATLLPAQAFVYCIQNHDQVGNRALGDRITEQISLADYAMISTLLLFLPMTPLLFMGQEWAASTPFAFFSDHDAELGRLVSRGRREEFKAFRAFADATARARIPDPQAPETFEHSRLRWEERKRASCRCIGRCSRSARRTRS